jgi:hypothetical protein
MSTLQLLAAQKVPLEFGALRMDKEGNLVERSATTLTFGFTVDQMPYECVLNRLGANDLRISARLGHVPFSAENRQARVDLLTLVAAAKGAIPFGNISVSQDQSVTLEARICIDAPMNPLAILTAVTEVLRDSLPWSTAIRNRIAAARPVRAQTSQGAVGKAKIWPG